MNSVAAEGLRLYLQRILPALLDGYPSSEAPFLLPVGSEAAIVSFLESESRVLIVAAHAGALLGVFGDAAHALPPAATQWVVIRRSGFPGDSGLSCLVHKSAAGVCATPSELLRAVQSGVSLIARSVSASRRLFDNVCFPLELPESSLPSIERLPRLQASLRRLQSNLSKLQSLLLFPYESEGAEIDEFLLFQSVLQSFRYYLDEMAGEPSLEACLSELRENGQGPTSEMISDALKQIPSQAEDIQLYLADLASLVWLEPTQSLPSVLRWLEDTETSIRRFKSQLALSRRFYLNGQILSHLMSQIRDQWSEARNQRQEELQSFVLPSLLLSSLQFFHPLHQITSVTLLWKTVPGVLSEYKLLQIRLNSVEDCIQSLSLARSLGIDSLESLEATMSEMMQESLTSPTFGQKEDLVHELLADVGKRFFESRLSEFAASQNSYYGLLKCFLNHKEVFQHPFIGKEARSVLSAPLRAIASQFVAKQNALVTLYRSSYQGTNLDLLNSFDSISPGNGVILWKEQIQYHMTQMDKDMSWILGDEWGSLNDYRPFHLLFEKIRKLNFFDDRATVAPFPTDSPILRLVEEANGRRLEANIDPNGSFVGNNFEVLKYYYRRNFNRIMPLDSQPANYSPIFYSINSLLLSFHRNAALLTDLEIPLIRSEYDCVLQMLRTIYERQVAWRSQSHVSDLYEALTRFNRSFLRASEMMDAINNDFIHRLRICAFDSVQLQSIMKHLCSFVFDCLGDSPIGLQFYSELNQRIGSVLQERLRLALEGWLTEAEHFQASDPATKPSESSIRLHLILRTDNHVDIAPSLEQAHQKLFDRFHQCVGIVAALPRVEPRHFNKQETFFSLAQSIPDDLLSRLLIAVEQTRRSMQDVVGSWNHYSALWSLDIAETTSGLQDDVASWLSFLEELEQSKLDLEATDKPLGLVVIDTRSAYSSIDSRLRVVKSSIYGLFDPVLRRFAGRIASGMSASQSEFDSLVITTVDLADFSRNYRFWENLRSALPQWEADIELASKGTNLMVRYKEMDLIPHLRLSLMSLKEAESVLSCALAHQIPLIRTRFDSSVSEFADRMEALRSRWDENISHLSHARSDDAVVAVRETIVACDRLEAMLTALSDCAVLLGTTLGVDRSCVTTLHDIASQYLEAWLRIAPLSEQFLKLNRTKWQHVDIDSTSRILMDISHELTALLPVVPPQFSPLRALHSDVESAVQRLQPLSQLQASSLSDRHWDSILLQLPRGSIDAARPRGQIPLSAFFGSGITVESLQPILAQAQGESVIDDFLRKSLDTWSAFRIPMETQSQLGPVIADFNSPLDELQSDILTMQSLKSSPHYSRFKEQMDTWEGRLVRIRDILEEWRDIQQRWTSLHKVFTKTRDIRTRMSYDFSAFKSADVQLQPLYSMLREQPVLFQFVSVHTHIEEILQSILSDLSITQKELSLFLENQRFSFPRFFFIGDDDLVDILGSVERVSLHLDKMFVGVHSVTLDKSSQPSLATHFNSREGESILFVSPLSLGSDLSTGDFMAAMESSIRSTLRNQFPFSLQQLLSLDDQPDRWRSWIEETPMQLILLCIQLYYSNFVEESLRNHSPLSKVSSQVQRQISMMMHILTSEDRSFLRFKCEQLIIEYINERDISRELESVSVSSPSCHQWSAKLKYSYDFQGENGSFSVSVLTASFPYGFEYLGLFPRLVQTPLTDQFYLSLSHALSLGLGGNPFGPAGTGKTETVKALGRQFGRFIAVFNCNEKFEINSLSRILQGICSIGGWCCLDEINRLIPGVLSALSQQVQLILQSVRGQAKEVFLSGRAVQIQSSVGLFITMNPDYLGRSPLPSNLKQLFRSFAMISPDLLKIAEVLFFIYGFENAVELASTVVSLFRRSSQYLTFQKHYDFTLRCLKSVILLANRLKRTRPEISDGSPDTEFFVVRESILSVMRPKLVPNDTDLFQGIVDSSFRDRGVQERRFLRVSDAPCFREVLASRSLSAECLDWNRKVDEFVTLLDVCQGIILSGCSGTGKSSLWRAAIEVLHRNTGVASSFAVVNPKSLSREELYGSFVGEGNEWKDGVLSSLIRKHSLPTNTSSAPFFIVFDGEIDSLWAENLNSVLDSNQVFTLPSGEHFSTSNIKLVFEVGDCQHVTLATISRCGVLWFDSSTISNNNMFASRISRMRASPNTGAQSAFLRTVETMWAPVIKPSLEWALSSGNRSELIPVSFCHALNRFLALVEAARSRVADKVIPSSFPGDWIAYSLFWSCEGSLLPSSRESLLNRLSSSVGSHQLGSHLKSSVLSLSSFEWVDASDSPSSPVSEHGGDGGLPFIATLARSHSLHLLSLLLPSRRLVVLYGPPGCGKRVLLRHFSEQDPGYHLVTLCCSRRTQPSDVIRLLEQYCSYETVQSRRVLRPKSSRRELLLLMSQLDNTFSDSSGSRPLLSLLRSFIDQHGFWHPQSLKWIEIHQIALAATVNVDAEPKSLLPGLEDGDCFSDRFPIPERLLTHSFLISVCPPAEEALGAIVQRALSHFLLDQALVCSLSKIMVSFILFQRDEARSSQSVFQSSSLGQLTAWLSVIRRCIASLPVVMDPSERATDIIRLCFFSGASLFESRLSSEADCATSRSHLIALFSQAFSGVCVNCDPLEHLLPAVSLLASSSSSFADWVNEKISLFNTEVSPHPVYLFSDSLRSIEQIHFLLCTRSSVLTFLLGDSGTGKRLLTKFVCWMNEIAFFQIKPSSSYSFASFDEDLRSLVRRVAIQKERVCFFFGEALLQGSEYLERLVSIMESEDFFPLFDASSLQTLQNEFEHTLEGSSARRPSAVRSLLRSAVASRLTVICSLSPDRVAHLFPSFPASFSVNYDAQILRQWSLNSYASLASQCLAVLNFPGGDIAVRESLLDPRFSQLFEAIHRVSTSFSQKLASCRSHFFNTRRYLELILCFSSLVRDRSRSFIMASNRLKSGLETLERVKTEVSESRAVLEQKHAFLKIKQEEASAALKEILREQSEAEEKKHSSEQLQNQIRIQEEEISERKREVQENLQIVEQSLEEAKRSVNSIQRSDLDEVRSLNHPPKNIERTLEMVCILLEERFQDWNDIRRILVKNDFISKVVNYSADRLTPAKVASLRTDYFDLPGFNFEAVDRSSRAAGPLFRWIDSQLCFCEIVSRVQPLREEIASLESRLSGLHSEHTLLETTIRDMGHVIASSRVNYARLIQEASDTEREMELVQKRHDRAISLLSSLSVEHLRWRSLWESMNASRSSMVPDALFCSSYLSYCGILSLSERKRLQDEWRSLFGSAGASFTLSSDLDVVDCLAAPLDRYQWQAQGPQDDLSLQNSVMVTHLSRFILLLDPIGAGRRFVLQQHSSLSVLSCLTKGYMLQLQAAVKVGSSVLLEHVEYMDASIYALLNCEEERSGGQTLVSLDGSVICLHPDLKLYLHTTVSESLIPNYEYLFSRLSVVNYSLSHTSLKSHFVNEFILLRSADLLERQKTLMEQELKQQTDLRQLEDSLLDQLSAESGSILDNDSVLGTLERLKSRVVEVETQLRETHDLTQTLKQELRHFEPLSEDVASCFFLLKSLSSLNSLYQFNLAHYTEFIKSLAVSTALLSRLEAGPFASALPVLLRGLFLLQQPSLMPHDLTCFTLKLIELSLQKHHDPAGLRTLSGFQSLLIQSYQPSTVQGAAQASRYAHYLSLSFVQQEELCSLFSEIENGESWLTFLNGPFLITNSPESLLPECPSVSTIALLVTLLRFVQILTPDRFGFAVERLARSLFDDCAAACRSSPDSILLDRPVNAPVLYCSPSVNSLETRLQLLSDRRCVPYNSVSMGTSSSREAATRFLSQIGSAAQFLVLVNVHLDLSWLAELERTLSSLKLHPNSLLFLCLPAEGCFHLSSIPSFCTLLIDSPSFSLGRIALESASLLLAVFCDLPNLFIPFLLIWVHSQFVLRLLYIPYGWARDYSFSESELRSSISSFLSLWESAFSSRSTDLSLFPWDILCITLEKSIYGGKMTNDRDKALLHQIIAYYIRPEILRPDCNLLLTGDPVLHYDHSIGSPAELLTWLSSIPPFDDPSALGLTASSSETFQRTQTELTFSSIYTLQNSAPVTAAPVLSDGDLTLLLRRIAEEFFPSVPVFSTSSKAASAIPIGLSKEYSSLCEFQRFLVHESRSILSQPPDQFQKSSLFRLLRRNAVPGSWLSLESSLSSHSLRSQVQHASQTSSVSFTIWLKRSEHRFTHFQQLCSSESEESQTVVCLSCLFHPEAFLLISRFRAAESLHVLPSRLRLVATGTGAQTPRTLVLSQMVVDGGATIRDGSLCPDGSIRNLCPQLRLFWSDIGGTESDSLRSIPVYSDSRRTSSIGEVFFPVSGVSSQGPCWPDLRGLALFSDE